MHCPNVPWRCLLVACLLTLQQGPTRADTPPCVTVCADPPANMLVAPEGNAVVPVTVCNRSEQPVHLQLRLSDFSFADTATKANVAAGSTSRLVAAEAAETAIVSGAAPLAPGCVGLRIEVAGLWQAGVSTATLSNGDDTLTTLTALRRHAPFRIGFDGPNPQRAELKIVKGEQASLMLFNEDDMSYRFHWRLEVPDVAASGVAHVRPNRSARLVVGKPGGSISGFESGFLRSAVREGRLMIEHEPDAALEPYALPRRALDVRATISSFGPTWQAIWNVVFIFALLVLGIVASLLINYALPMQRRRVLAKQRLDLLEGRMGGLGNLVPSRLLSLLRVEKKRLREELRALWPVYPTTEAALPKFEAQIDWIDRRIALVAGAGEQLAALADVGVTLAVPEADRARDACRTVFDIVAKPTASEDDIRRAEAALRVVEELRLAAAQPPTPAMLQAMAELAAKVRTRVAAGAMPAGRENAIQELVEALLRDVPDVALAPPTGMDTADYVDAALAVAKTEVIADYKHLLAGAHSADVLMRRTRCAAELHAALCPGPEESLARARCIVLEAEQGVNEDDLATLLRAAGPADLWIDVDPPRPLPQQLVALRVRLRQPGLDEAVARARIECAWRVTDGEIGSDDWVASYFFDKPGTAGWWAGLQARFGRSAPPAAPPPVKVAATLSYRGSKLVDATPVEVLVEAPKSYLAASTWLSLGAMLATMLLVAVGLIAGAQEKIQSLDWVAGMLAILALGFGADVLKRVLTKA